MFNREDKNEASGIAAREFGPSYLGVWKEFLHALLSCIQIKATQNIILQKVQKILITGCLLGFVHPTFLGTINNYTQRPGEWNHPDNH